MPAGEGEAETIDNCQHILLRCCVNLLDFYERLGVRDRIRFYREFYFHGARRPHLGAAPRPAAGAVPFRRLVSAHALPGPRATRLGIARALLALRRERTRRKDLDRISMLDWLLQKRQTPRAIDRFWRQVLVSAVNEDLDRMAAVPRLPGLLAGLSGARRFLRDGRARGAAGGALREPTPGSAWPNVRIHLRAPVEAHRRRRLRGGGRAAHGAITTSARCPSSAWRRVGLPAPRFEHSPITGVHLWFDREITTLPHATLLDRTMQWMFNKDRRPLPATGGERVARSDQPVAQGDHRYRASATCACTFPRVREATLVKAHVVKEQRATFSAAPGHGSAAARPRRPALPNLFLAGDWTRTGWPATMEGAVRSGYLAAEAVARAAGKPAEFLLPDIG